MHSRLYSAMFAALPVSSKEKDIVIRRPLFLFCANARCIFFPTHTSLYLLFADMYIYPSFLDIPSHSIPLCFLGCLDSRLQTAPEVHDRKEEQANSHAGRAGVVRLSLGDEARVLIMTERVNAHLCHALHIRQTRTLVVDRELEHSVLIGQLKSGREGADSALIIQRNLLQSLAHIRVQHDQFQLNIVR